MKNTIVLLIILVFISQLSFAKKDINAWKSAANADEQFAVFKENLNFWNGSYFMKEAQLNEFYSAITDTIVVMKKEVANAYSERNAMEEKMNAQINLAKETQSKLDESIKNQNSISVLGLYINKNVYSVTMYIIIAAVLGLAGFVFLLFIRSNKTTIHTKKEYSELKEEFEIHKKNSLDRYTKINTELHKTRMELNRR